MRAHTLIELMMGLIISALMLCVAVPLFQGPIADARFHAFGAELTGNLVMARRYAQISHRPVWLEFSDDPRCYYRCWVERETGDMELISEHIRDTKSPIDLRLFEEPLPHPTQGSMIGKPLSSTHGERIHFTHVGSSAVTLTYTDGLSRAYCAVISPNSGRIRAFLWEPSQKSWLPFF
ncbi:MAG: hypothetical protein KDC35_14560 [Acidobacteria bacterium]|nr:hypothetical protein [Acidobacteriota bacterium]